MCVCVYVGVIAFSFCFGEDGEEMTNKISKMDQDLSSAPSPLKNGHSTEAAGYEYKLLTASI